MRSGNQAEQKQANRKEASEESGTYFGKWDHFGLNYARIAEEVNKFNARVRERIFGDARTLQEVPYASAGLPRQTMSFLQ
jgi:hypothetical protein